MFLVTAAMQFAMIILEIIRIFRRGFEKIIKYILIHETYRWINAGTFGKGLSYRRAPATRGLEQEDVHLP